MKKVLLFTLFATFATASAVAQFTPTPRAAYIYSGGLWSPLAGAGAQIGPPNPTPTALYVRSGGNWVAWDGSISGGGAPTGPCGGDLGGTYPNCTVVGSHIVSGSAALTGSSSVISSTSTSSAPTMLIRDSETGGANMAPLKVLSPNMTNNTISYYTFGQAESTNNAFLWGYVASSLAGGNRLTLQAYGEAIGFTMYAATSNVNIGNSTGDAGYKLDVFGSTRSNSYATTANCNSSASPAVCAAATSGSVVLAAAATTVTVNTTAVTANSQIYIQPDASLGTRLGVTCNTTPTFAWPSARVAGTSFTITSTAPTTNPMCMSYTIIN